MTNYAHLTKTELIQRIEELEAAKDPNGATGSSQAREHERLLHELQVHQAELETQNAELRQMQRLLEESRDRYADLYDFAPVGYLTTNAHGVIQVINLTGAALLGPERARLVGMPLARFVSADQAQKLIEHLRQCQRQSGSTSTDLTLSVVHYPPKVVQLVSVALKDTQTDAPLIRTTMTDITERTRAEEHVRELNQELIRRSTELESSNQESEALVYSVSHDLRAPLNLIEQLSDELRQDYGHQLSEEARGVLDLIYANTLAANRLAEQLLVLSRMEHQVLHKQPVAMRELAKQALEQVQADENGRQVEISWGDLPAAEAEPSLVKQVWVNLLSNALKFTRLQETTRIEIGSSNKDGEVIYWVKDNGVGFDMSDADRLFRVFQRLHHSEDFPGNGLGLAIVARLVHRHGGRVGVQAQIDKGATFWFTLG